MSFFLVIPVTRKVKGYTRFLVKGYTRLVRMYVIGRRKRYRPHKVCLFLAGSLAESIWQCPCVCPSVCPFVRLSVWTLRSRKLLSCWPVTHRVKDFPTNIVTIYNRFVGKYSAWAIMRFCSILRMAGLKRFCVNASIFYFHTRYS